jgi:hypothetical protein
MPVLNERSFPKAPFPTQKFEEARYGVGEWVRYTGRVIPVMRENQPK